MIGLRGQWIWHPESPGMKVWVVRGFWGRLFKSRDFATLSEVLASSEWRQG